MQLYRQVLSSGSLSPCLLQCCSWKYITFVLWGSLPPFLPSSLRLTHTLCCTHTHTHTHTHNRTNTVVHTQHQHPLTHRPTQTLTVASYLVVIDLFYHIQLIVTLPFICPQRRTTERVVRTMTKECPTIFLLLFLSFYSSDPRNVAYLRSPPGIDFTNHNVLTILTIPPLTQKRDSYLHVTNLP
jgi:hypothetical protein